MTKKILNRVLIIISVTMAITSLFLMMFAGLQHTPIVNNLLIIWSIIFMVASLVAPIKLKKVLTYSK